jgi:hypothetical protein
VVVVVVAGVVVVVVCVFFGAFATVIVTVEPFVTLLLADGLWLITSPAGTVEDTCLLTVTLKPLPLSVAVAACCD